MSNPHDRIFRRTFGDPEQVRDLLRNLMPQGLREAVDWGSLERVAGSFVDEQLAERHTDLLFRVQVDARQAFIVLLFEHQSTVDVWMPLRMLGYTVRIWEEHRAETPGARGLPLVCPVVLHHSATGWRGPRSVAELLDLDEATRRAAAEFIPDLSFALLDLTAHDDNQLHALVVHDIGSLVVSALKHAPYDSDFLERFPQWVEAWTRAVRAPGGLAALSAVTRYILEVRDNVAVDDFRRVLQSAVSPTAAEAIMTTAEQLRDEGRAEGRAEGRTQGRAETLLKLLALKFGDVPPGMRRRVETATMEELDSWTERVLSAQHLDDVLG